MQTEGQQPTSGEPDPTQPASSTTAVEERPALTTPTEPDAAETPGEGKVEGEDAEQRPVELPEGWRDHADAKAFRQEGHDEGAQTMQGTKDKEALKAKGVHRTEMQRAVELVQASQTVKDLTSAATAIVNTLRQSNDVEAAKTSLQDLMGENEQWAQVFSKELREEAQSRGEVTGQARAFGLLQYDLPKAIAEPLKEFIETKDLEYQAGDVTLDTAYVQSLAKLIELVRADEAAKVENLVAERKPQEERAAARERTKTAPRPGGSAGTGAGKDPDAILRDPSATPEQKTEAFNRKHGIDIDKVVPVR